MDLAGFPNVTLSHPPLDGNNGKKWIDVCVLYV